MKLLKYFMLIAVFQIFTEVVFSQNILQLANGKKISIGEYKVSENSFLSYKNQKGKLKSIELEEVFSIIDKSGNENLFYVADSSDNEAFNVEQMRFFINGESDALNNYKSTWTFIGGIAVGAGSVVSIPLAGLSSLYAPVFPLAYSSSVGLIKVKTEKLGIEKQYIDNEHYVLGFEKTAKQKRIKNSLLGSGIGIAVGLSAALLFFN
ncbi:MAG: hypothetical protein JXR51_05225 [Bacteroidales bacterium]|nr:hypothetical protein [Bacteroidales bacterium]MBN2756561.1 hypothetical protein [Bacteroidales bacterium]